MKKLVTMIIALTLTAAMLLGMSGAVMAEEGQVAEEPPAASNLPDQINIVLFGMSGDNDGLDTNRSDSIIVVTIDNLHKQLKFSSILRDLKAPMEGHEPQKINAAYRYGGAEMALQTLNDDFGLDLHDYITVEWGPFIDIVNAFGGVDVVLTAAEAEYLNDDPVLDEYMPDAEFYEGPMHLWGLEAIEYCRIRKIDSDVVRSDRQRKVLTDMMNTAMAMSPVDFMNLALSFLDIVTETNLTPAAIKTLVSIPYDEYTIINNHFPDADLDGDVSGGIDEHGEWVWWADFGIMSQRFNDIIYNEQPAQNLEG